MPRFNGANLQIVSNRQINQPIDELGRPVGIGVDVELEDFGGQPQRRTGVGNIDDAADMPLYRRRAEQRSLGLGTL